MERRRLEHVIVAVSLTRATEERITSNIQGSFESGGLIQFHLDISLHICKVTQQQLHQLYLLSILVEFTVVMDLTKLTALTALKVLTVLTDRTRTRKYCSEETWKW